MAGVAMGVCLLAFCTGVLAVGTFGMNLGIEGLRTLAFVVLVFGSQAAIYAVRERRHLWGSRPSLLLVVSSVIDIAIASTLAVGGIAMRSLPASLVAATLAAAAVFAVILDLVKVPIFASLGIAQSPRHPETTQRTPAIATAKEISSTEPTSSRPGACEAKPDTKAVKPNLGADPDAKTVLKPETKAALKSEAKVRLDSEVKTEPKPEAKATTPADLTPRIARRAYELYEQGGRTDGAAVQN